MDESMLTIGAAATCSDGQQCGEVIRVVVNPLARAVTHLVIEPEHRQGLGRLVPLDLITSSESGVLLACTLEEFERLDIAEETDFLPGTVGYLEYNPASVLVSPYFGLGTGVSSLPVTYDRLPLGEVSIRRNAPVHATDGAIGKIHGVVIDPSDHHVTHVLLQEGHLWGRHDVAIPVSAVETFGTEIQLRITQQEVRDLPPVDIANFES
jgi:sporulation protein YlmC with PRC-barrel domain